MVGVWTRSFCFPFTQIVADNTGAPGMLRRFPGNVRGTVVIVFEELKPHVMPEPNKRWLVVLVVSRPYRSVLEFVVIDSRG